MSIPLVSPLVSSSELSGGGVPTSISKAFSEFYNIKIAIRTYIYKLM